MMCIMCVTYHVLCVVCCVLCVMRRIPCTMSCLVCVSCHARVYTCGGSHAILQ